MKKFTDDQHSKNQTVIEGMSKFLGPIFDHFLHKSDPGITFSQLLRIFAENSLKNETEILLKELVASAKVEEQFTRKFIH